MRTYSFTAIFDYEIGGINIFFPDLPGYLSGAYTKEEALFMAKEALELYLSDMEDKAIPQPTKYEDIQLINDQEKYSITVEV